MQYFKLSEFKCKCDRGVRCDAVQMNSKTMEMVDELRRRYRKALIITSGERCSYWNDKWGGEDESYHLIGCAVDIKVTDGIMVGKLVQLALEIGFTGIGISKKGFLHLDTRGGKLCIFGY